MTELVITIQDYLARAGAPDWLLKPGSWLAIACGLAAMAIIARLLVKRSREVQPAAPVNEPPTGEPGGGGRGRRSRRGRTGG